MRLPPRNRADLPEIRPFLPGPASRPR